MISKKTLIATATAALLWAAPSWANTKETVEQVAGTITLTTDVDYIISSETPFADDGVVNIENTDHAVLILAGVKPSAARSLLASHVQINGVPAANNSNCQLKLYNRGSIIMPYDKSLKPLTVYSEQNFEGETCNDFGLENDGGFMNTLTDEKLNNRIRSFRLKRGYMVTFSLRARGRGYSRCFIAADKDLEMATLPGILDRSITSYRIFKWYDTGKPQLAAAGGDMAACRALNVTSTYTWSAGSDMSPDVENVPHHIYEDWPSASACGQATWSPHLKTNNEPRNAADDHQQDLKTILDNWENLMATGMRLCSPSSWDGSDYWNGTGFLKEFFDSIDARGWRCDIVDMHCYWPEANFPNLRNWLNAVHRPIWISEWCWGASWNSNGAFANGVTETQVRDALQRICTTLNGYNYVERYFYWNGERDPSRIYKNGSLTPAGEMYSQLDGGVGYNGSVNYVPKVPKQQDPKDFLLEFDKASGTISFMWYTYNAETNEFIHLERRKSLLEPWETVMDITGIEMPGIHLFRGVEAQQGWEFRICEKDANGKEHYTKSLTAASDDMGAGDPVNISNGETLYLGGNLIVNGSFDLGNLGWTNGQGNPVGLPWFQIVPVGDKKGGPYLQNYGHSTSLDAEQSLKVDIDLQPNTYYYFTADACNCANPYNWFSLKNSEKGDSIVSILNNATGNWITQFSVFNSGSYDKAQLNFRSMGSKAQFDNIMLFKLFPTEEEALADGLAQAKLRLQAAVSHLGDYWNHAMKESMDEADQMSSNREAIACISHATDSIIYAHRVLAEQLPALTERVQALKDKGYQFPGYDELDKAWQDAGSLLLSSGIHRAGYIIHIYEALKEAFEAYLPMNELTGKVQSPTFQSATGWQTKAGTYQGGDQRLNTANGITFWNAWWNLDPASDDGQTLAIRQELTGLEHGLYAVECLAATEHYCLSDQHAYISNGTDSVNSPTLTANYYDLPSVPDSLRWERLTTLPIYVEEDGAASVGFQSSKQGATDLAWRQVGNTNSKGDHREGWWGATDFRLLFHPLYRAEMNASGWGVVCLPYDVYPTTEATFYQIAAITSDFKTLCLEEISQGEAGVPFIYHSDAAAVNFLEHGEAVKSASDGPGNLRGYLKTTNVSRVPKGGYYILTDGVWKKHTDDNNRPRVGNFTGLIRPFTDSKSRHLPIVNSWTGATMPIEGVTDEEMVAGVSQLKADNEGAAVFYSLGGQQVAQPQPGIYIKITNGKKTKTIIK